MVPLVPFVFVVPEVEVSVLVVWAVTVIIPPMIKAAATIKFFIILIFGLV